MSDIVEPRGKVKPKFKKRLPGYMHKRAAIAALRNKQKPSVGPAIDPGMVMGGTSKSRPVVGPDQEPRLKRQFPPEATGRGLGNRKFTPPGGDYVPVFTGPKYVRTPGAGPGNSKQIPEKPGGGDLGRAAAAALRRRKAANSTS